MHTLKATNTPQNLDLVLDTVLASSEVSVTNHPHASSVADFFQTILLPRACTFWLPLQLHRPRAQPACLRSRSCLPDRCDRRTDSDNHCYIVQVPGL